MGKKEGVPSYWCQSIFEWESRVLLVKRIGRGKRGMPVFFHFVTVCCVGTWFTFKMAAWQFSKILLLFLWSSWSDQNREQTAARPEPAALSLRTGQLISGSTRWSDADIYCFHPGKFYRRQISILRSTPARNLLTIKLFLTVIDSRLQELRMYICKRCTHIEIIVIIIIPSGWVAVPLG